MKDQFKQHYVFIGLLYIYLFWYFITITNQLEFENITYASIVSLNGVNSGNQYFLVYPIILSIYLTHNLNKKNIYITHRYKNLDKVFMNCYIKPAVEVAIIMAVSIISILTNLIYILDVSVTGYGYVFFNSIVLYTGYFILLALVYVPIYILIDNSRISIIIFSVLMVLGFKFKFKPLLFVSATLLTPLSTREPIGLIAFSEVIGVVVILMLLNYKLLKRCVLYA